MAKTHTITFDDDSEDHDTCASGDWWTLRTYLPVALEREYIQHAIDAQATILTEDNPEPDMALVQTLAERMDKLVVGSTIAWSYGPVDIETLYKEVPGPHYMQVAEWIGVTYGPLVCKSIERGLEVYTQLSSQKEE